MGGLLPAVSPGWRTPPGLVSAVQTFHFQEHLVAQGSCCSPAAWSRFQPQDVDTEKDLFLEGYFLEVVGTISFYILKPRSQRQSRTWLQERLEEVVVILGGRRSS